MNEQRHAAAVVSWRIPPPRLPNRRSYRRAARSYTRSRLSDSHPSPAFTVGASMPIRRAVGAERGDWSWSEQARENATNISR